MIILLLLFFSCVNNAKSKLDPLPNQVEEVIDKAMLDTGLAKNKNAYHIKEIYLKGVRAEHLEKVREYYDILHNKIENRALFVERALNLTNYPIYSSNCESKDKLKKIFEKIIMLKSDLTFDYKATLNEFKDYCNKEYVSPELKQNIESLLDDLEDLNIERAIEVTLKEELKTKLRGKKDVIKLAFTHSIRAEDLITLNNEIKRLINNKSKGETSE